LNQKELK